MSIAARIRSTAAPFIGLPAKGAVEIDAMQPFETLAREGGGLIGGIVIEDRGLLHVALNEADAMAFLQIDRGKENHGRHLRKLAIRARPSFWLFSGWNCVPAMLSRATIAVTGPP